MGQELVALQAKLAEQAVAAAENEAVSSGTFLSTKSGTLAFGDEVLPGNQVCVVIIDAVRENTYYEGKFNPDVMTAPVCYAFGRDKDEDMGPHPSMQAFPEDFVPQNDTCRGCPKNEWGSADTGRGKACQNRRRLVLLPAGSYVPKRGSRDFDLELFNEEEHFRTADPAFLKLPPTSVEEWSKYVSQISAAHRLPPHGVITRIYIETHPKHQYHVKFEMVEKVPDDQLAAIMERHEQSVAMPYVGYQPPEQGDSTVAPGAVRGLRRR